MARITGINIIQPLAVILEILLRCLGRREQSVCGNKKFAENWSELSAITSLKSYGDVRQT